MLKLLNVSAFSKLTQGNLTWYCFPKEQIEKCLIRQIGQSLKKNRVKLVCNLNNQILKSHSKRVLSKATCWYAHYLQYSLGAIQEKYGRDNVYIRTGSNQKQAFSKKIVFLHLVREPQLTYNAALVAYTDATL